MTKFTIQQLQQMRESEDIPLMRVGEEFKPMSDAMYLKILHESEPDFSEKICEGLLISAQDGYKLSDRYYEIAKNVGTVENTQKNDTKNVQVNDTVNLSQLTERQRKIYCVIKNVPVNVPNLATMLGVSEKTIKRDIAAMQSVGLIKRVGSDKTGHWEVTEE